MTGDHLGDHLYPQAETTQETTTPEPPENPTSTGRDHLQDHRRPPGPGEGVEGGPCKGTTPTPHPRCPSQTLTDAHHLRYCYPMATAAVTGIVENLQALATPIDALELLPGNPRVGDVDAVAASLRRFGQRKPIVANTAGVVIAGNHTLQAARQLGWTHIAVVRVDDDDATAKAFALADNRTAELGSYDDAALEAMVRDVLEFDAELLADTGWAGEDLEALLSSVDIEELPPADADPDAVPDRPPATTVPGDVWLLGPHRLLCGDCRVPTDVDKLMAGTKIALAFTSPPYAEQREYDTDSGFKPIHPDAYVEWFDAVQANVAAHLADDGSWFVNIKAASRGLDTELYVLELVRAHAQMWGWHWAAEFCWERPGIPQRPARRFKNQFEPIYQFARGEWKFRPEAVTIASDHVPTYSSSHPLSAANQGVDFVFDKDDVGEGMAYPGNRLPTFSGSHEALGHGAAFPVGLPEWFMAAYTDPGDAVYDPFMGSGSTLIAAERSGRVAYGVELSAAYCDVICRRYQRATGIKPIAEATGRPHDFEAVQ